MRWWAGEATAERPNSSTLSGAYARTLVRSYARTLVRSYSPTLLRSYARTLVRSYSPILSYAPTLVLLYSLTAQAIDLLRLPYRPQLGGHDRLGRQQLGECSATQRVVARLQDGRPTEANVDVVQALSETVAHHLVGGRR